MAGYTKVDPELARGGYDEAMRKTRERERTKPAKRTLDLDKYLILAGQQDKPNSLWHLCDVQSKSTQIDSPGLKWTYSHKRPEEVIWIVSRFCFTAAHGRIAVLGQWSPTEAI